MTNQWRRAAAVVAVATMTLAACGSTPPAATSTPGASATVALKRGAGDDLKILYWQAPTILNAHLATGTKDSDAARLVLEPLASYGPDAKPLANGLAAEIPTVANGGVSADLLTVTWKLKQGVKWSDGSAFTADDVAFTFSLMSDPKTAVSTSDSTEGVKSVVAKDANTVVVTYAAANPNIYQWGVGTCCYILQKKQFEAFQGEKLKDAPGNLKPIGTGPYVVDTFKSGDVVTYKMNDQFRDPNKPYFKTVTFKGGGDAPSAARAVFQTGDIDYGWNLQVEAGILKPMADQSTKGKLLTVYGSSVERLLLNFADPSASLGDKRGEPDTKHPFFNGPDGKTVRTALAMATDRKTVAQQIYGDGLAGKAGCNIVTGVPDYESTATTDFCNKFDTAAAGKLLDDAGWKLGSDGVRAKGGIKLNIVYQTTVNAVRQKTQDIMKKNWEAAGFKVELKQVPADVFFTNTSPDGANHFWADVEMFTNNSDPDFTNYLNGWTSKQATGKANTWNSANYNRYQNPAYDTIIDQLRSEKDPAKRATLFKQANDILILDVVIIPVVTRTQVTSGMSNTLKNVVPTGWDSEMYAIQDWSK
ncbi:MAG TPA: peptide ABC transporter substrate-binding protein [Candidatus Limnocylindria bacterium]|jgi:peptide/nickel transport system substrate-binding protein|nr:peptide ABC transporter substrate-binding protein [Candidatus Limnocylindria bacterium]